MTTTNAKEALVWLYNNNASDVWEFYKVLRTVNIYAVSVCFSTNPEQWTRQLKKQVRRLLTIDRVYFEGTGKHFMRLVNLNSKRDMIDFISELNTVSHI